MILVTMRQAIRRAKKKPLTMERGRLQPRKRAAKAKARARHWKTTTRPLVSCKMMKSFKPTSSKRFSSRPRSSFDNTKMVRAVANCPRTLLNERWEKITSSPRPKLCTEVEQCNGVISSFSDSNRLSHNFVSMSSTPIFLSFLLRSRTNLDLQQNSSSMSRLLLSRLLHQNTPRWQ
jgi:hypothetical protein